jgi:hypothetical protein
MSNPEQATVTTLRQPKVLDQLQEGVRTWDQLRALTKINDENLGVTIMELLNQRKIWVAHKNEVRVYGLERRSGLVPRFSVPQRRSTDRIDTAKERRVQ